jgi:hypothetical protein
MSASHGVNREYAHSMEEIIYHLQQLQGQALFPCSPGWMQLGRRSPHHPTDRTVEEVRWSQRCALIKPPQPWCWSKGGPVALPSGSPILYASPAPVSRRACQHLLCLDYRISSQTLPVVRAHLRIFWWQQLRVLLQLLGTPLSISIR